MFTAPTSRRPDIFELLLRADSISSANAWRLAVPRLWQLELCMAHALQYELLPSSGLEAWGLGVHCLWQPQLCLQGVLRHA